MKSLLQIAATALLITGGAACALAASQPKVIAHRGYWDTPGSAQNSIRALVKADSIGCYASEFDVWLTADSVAVVNHDPEFNGVHIESSTAAEVTALKLANGENLPTLEEYLTAAEPLGIRLVLELKAHDSLSHERLAISKILEAVDRHGLGDCTDYITFSPTAFATLVREAPAPAKVYYLTGNMIPAQVKFLGGAGIDYSFGDISKHPEWMKEAHDLGLEVNIWTVNKEADMRRCIEDGADYITTNDPETLFNLLRERK